MKSLRNALLVFCILLGGVVPSTQAKDLWMEGAAHPQKRVNQDITHLSPKAYYNVSQAFGKAVVNISTVQIMKGYQTPFGFRIDPDTPPDGRQPFSPFFDYFFGNPGGQPPTERKHSSLGSGFVLNQDGYIVTNNHVVAKADEIKVKFVDEREVPAEVVGRDPKTDVALLKIKPFKGLTPVIMGSSDDMSPGDVVVAIGNPFGLSHSITQGIVSAKERAIGLGPYDDFIQTDASINPGNSGGPLMNLYGEVIGINTAIHSAGQGIGFAIPIDMAKDVLLRLRESGTVIRGYLGVRVQEVKEEHIEALGLSSKKGALVMEVIKNTPASKAGIEPGDVIRSFNGKEVVNWNDLPLMVANTKVGRRAKVQIIRDKKPRTITVVIERLDDGVAQAKDPKGNNMQDDPLGLQVVNLDDETRRMLGLSEAQKGVLIEDVARDSVAAMQGVRPGDVIIRLNRKSVENLKAYQAIAKNIQKDDTVLITLLREKRKLFLAFRVQ